MKAHSILRFAFLIFTLSFILSRPLAAETLEAESSIKKVVVFPDRALVTRSAKVKLTPGRHEILFKNLPGILETDSLNSKGEGTARVKLYGARIVSQQLEKSQPPKVAELQEEIRLLTDRKQAIEETKKALDAKEEFLKSIKAASSDQIGKDIMTKQPAVEDVQKMLDLFERGFSDIYQKRHDLATEQYNIDQRVDKLVRELAEVQQNSFEKQQIVVAVDVESENAGDFTAEISYRVPEASWEPIYEARAASGANKVQLITQALIRQRTGEEWKNVALEISTARPEIGGRMPEIEPWFLRKYEPPQYPQPILMARRAAAGGAMMKAQMADAVQESYAAAPAPASVEAVVPTADIKAQATAVNYLLPHAETIPSDWQPRKATVLSLNLPTELAYETTPRLSPKAYLRAKVTNQSDAVLLPGQVQIFLDDSFVGTSALDLVGVDEKFDLYLGVNDKIRVTQKQLKAKEDVSILSGLHGKIKSIEYSYVTTVENFQKTEAEVFVFDSVPVSQHDEIKIENVKYDPKPFEQAENKPGVQVWKLKVGAGKKQEVKVSYTVKYPVDFVVTNL